MSTLRYLGISGVATAEVKELDQELLTLLYLIFGRISMPEKKKKMKTKMKKKSMYVLSRRVISIITSSPDLASYMPCHAPREHLPLRVMFVEETEGFGWWPESATKQCIKYIAMEVL